MINGNQIQIIIIQRKLRRMKYLLVDNALKPISEYIQINSLIMNNDTDSGQKSQHNLINLMAKTLNAATNIFPIRLSYTPSIHTPTQAHAHMVSLNGQTNNISI